MAHARFINRPHFLLYSFTLSNTDSSNQWTVNNLFVRRYLKVDLPKIGAQFEFSCTYHKECYVGPVVQAWEMGQFARGWLPVSQPFECGKWADEDNKSGSADAEFHNMFVLSESRFRRNRNSRKHEAMATVAHIRSQRKKNFHQRPA
jgi:hypothetical protein